MVATMLRQDYGRKCPLAALVSYSLSKRLNMTVESSLSCGACLVGKCIISHLG